MDIKLGKLRQWAEEVISSREKTSINEEFSVLERDIELRKDGINKLILASETYYYTLSKKKASQALREEEKLLPIDILGIVMIQHGEQFGGDSVFGNSLVKLGSAHSQIATLQEAYALTFKDTFLTSLEKFRDEIKEYELLRKKLDSQKSAFDVATAKFEKMQNSKKEKDKVEAEDEMERAKKRFKETLEDLRAHIHAIQENEHSQLHELTALVDVEFNYVQNYLNVLKEVKAGWRDHKYQQSRNRNLSHRLAITSARNSTRRSNSSITGIPDIPVSLDSSEESDTPSKIRQRRSNSNGSSKTPSRPTSRLSRRRANSGAASLKEGRRTSTEDKEKEKEKSRRMSMAEWASSAMESVTGGKNKKHKPDRELFSALGDGLIESGNAEPGGTSRPPSSFLSIARLTSKSTTSTSNSKESLPIMTESSESSFQEHGKIMKPQSMQDRKKVVRAVHDFNGSSDELSFKAGMEIVVLNEVLDDWWMGEVGGATGMFPISYTEAVDSMTFRSSLPPRSLSKSPKPTNSRRASLTGRRSVLSTPKHLPEPLPAKDDGHDDKYLTSDTDEDDMGRLKPMTENAATSIYLGKFDNDSESFTLTIDESEDSEKKGAQQMQSGSGDDWITFDDGSEVEPQSQVGTQQPEAQQTHSPPFATPKQRTMSLFGSLSSSFKLPILDPAQQPLISRSKSDNPSFGPVDADNAKASSGQIRKAPPPPPPRRPSQNPTILPPIPMRKVPSGVSSGNTTEASSSPFNLSSHSLTRNENSSGSDVGYDRSPFESALELRLEAAREVNCDKFRQNPFKPKGMCSDCLQFHEL